MPIHTYVSGEQNGSSSSMEPEKKTKYNQTDYRQEVPSVGKILTRLKNGGAWQDMSNKRTEKNTLREKVKAPFNGENSLDSKTKKTKLLKSYLIKTTASIYERTMRLPEFSVDPVANSKTSYDEKTNASITKSLLLWFMRVTGFESIYTESLFSFAAYGDTVRRPIFVDKLPEYEDLDVENLMIDPNSLYINSESPSKRAQYIAYTQMYTEDDLLDRFGEWIFDYAAPGTMLDDLSTFDVRDGIKYYEIVETQNRAVGQEFVLVGGNAFPVLMRGDGLGGKAPHPKASWTNKYLYKDQRGKNILSLGAMYFYFDDESQYNLGLANELAPVQNYHEILLNLTADNVRQRMRTIKYIIGGSLSKIEGQLDEYFAEFEGNINAMLKIPSSLNSTNKPEIGSLSVGGIPTQEALGEIQNAMDISKNMTGVSPQQQEVMQGVGLGQTEIMQEKSIEAIAAIAEKNVPQFIHELNMMMAFIIAHKGFDLNDTEISFTKYAEEFPQGMPDATISIVGASKKLKDYAYKVLIDNSSLVKRSRALERESNLKFLQSIDPSALPTWFDAIARRLAKIDGIDLPEVEKEKIQESQAQGGVSQFQGAAGGMEQPMPQGQPSPPMQ